MIFKDGKTFSAYVRSKLHSGYITLKWQCFWLMIFNFNLNIKEFNVAHGDQNVRIVLCRSGEDWHVNTGGGGGGWWTTFCSPCKKAITFSCELAIAYMNPWNQKLAFYYPHELSITNHWSWGGGELRTICLI